MSKFLVLSILILSAILYSKIQFSGEKVQVAANSGHSFEVYRDTKGVPHIFAHSIEDIMFGLGYSEAQDRLWALLIKKFLIEGRTA